MTARNDIQLTKYSIPNPVSSEKLIRWTWKPLRSFDETLLRTKRFLITVCHNKVNHVKGFLSLLLKPSLLLMSVLCKNDIFTEGTPR